MKKRPDLTKPIIATVIVAFIMTAMMITYHNYKAPTRRGSKNVIIKVIVPDEQTDTYKMYTDAEYLGDALIGSDFIGGESTDLGFFVTEVKGRVADSSKNEYWMLTKNGEYVNTGVDQTPVYDGDEFEFTLTKY